MSTTITFPEPDGAQYIIPAVDDVNWGQNVSDFLIAIPTGVMPRAGTFGLTGDVNFGASFGLVSAYIKSRSANIATAGMLRLAQTDAVEWRNHANSGNLALTVNNSDQLTFNGNVIGVAGSIVTSIIGTANQVIASAPTGAVTLSLPQDVAVGSSPTFAGMLLSGLTASAPVKTDGSKNLVSAAINLASGVDVTGNLPIGNIVTATNRDATHFLRGDGSWQVPNGSGTVVSGTANQLAYYPSSTNSVSGLTAITASKALASDTNGLPVAATTTATELNFVNGVTSAIQTQLNSKLNLAGGTMTGVVNLVGVSNGSSASAGIVGEYVESVVSTGTNFPASNTYGDLTSISLTAGDWDVCVLGTFLLNGATAAAPGVIFGVSITSGNSSTGLVLGDSSTQFNNSNSIGPSGCIPFKRFSFSSTTTVYLKYLCGFVGGNPQAVGRISARRAR